MTVSLSESELERYARQLSLPAFGPAGQDRLENANALVVGAGALGSPAAAYLAAAGVASIGLVDDGDVSLEGVGDSLLQLTADVGGKRAESVAAKLRLLNPAVQVDPYPARLDDSNSQAIATGYDIALDCTDDENAHRALSDACLALGLPLVIAGSAGLAGWVTAIDARQRGCYRCLEPRPGTLLGSGPAARGAIGALGGILGSLQALEALKLLTGAGEPLVGRLMLFDGLPMTVREHALLAGPECPACAPAPGRTGAVA